MDYLKGCCFLILFISFLTYLGKSANKNCDSFSMSLLVGYVIYTFFQAIGGILTQIFYISWIYYKYYMIFVIIMLLCFIFLRNKKEIKSIDIKIVKYKVIKHFKQYYILYILSLIILVLGLLNSYYLWMGNHQDDGWYLLKVANLPYLGNQYDINYATGFVDELGIYRAINTFELDYAFWCDLFQIYPSIFCKAIISYFNYFLILNAVYEFIQTVTSKDNNKIKYGSLAILLIPILLFSINQETLVNHKILAQQDGWHFNTAVWYGSAIVRCLSPYLLILPFIKKKRLTLSDAVFYIMICVTLFSKASQALPAIYIISMSFICAYLCIRLKEREKTVIITSIILVTVLVAFPQIGDGYLELKTYESAQLDGLLKSPIILFDLIVISYSFRLKNKYINYWNLCLLFMAILMFFPLVNKMFIGLSIYTFILGRTITLFIFSLTLTAFCYFGLICYYHYFNKLIISTIYLFIGIGCILVNLISQSNNFGLENSIAVLAHNPKLIPESTSSLSRYLEEISIEEGKTLNVLSPAWVMSDGFAHNLAVTLRINAPNIKSIGAIHRFDSMNQEIIYEDFDIEKQNQFESFLVNPEEGKENMFELLKAYPIDIIVVDNNAAAQSLINEFNFISIKEIDFPNEGKHYNILKNNQDWKSN